MSGKVRALPARDKQPRREPPTRETVLFLREQARKARPGLHLVRKGEEL